MFHSEDRCLNAFLVDDIFVEIFYSASCQYFWIACGARIIHARCILSYAGGAGSTFFSSFLDPGVGWRVYAGGALLGLGVGIDAGSTAREGRGGGVGDTSGIEWSIEGCEGVSSHSLDTFSDLLFLDALFSCLEQLFLLLTFYSAFFLSLALGIDGRLAAGWLDCTG